MSVDNYSDYTMAGRSEESCFPVIVNFLSSPQPTLALGPAMPPNQYLPVAYAGGVNLLTPPIAQIKKGGSYIITHHMSRGVQRDNFKIRVG